MECIILAFPDGFHLRTLDSFLTTASQLVPGVNVKQMLVGLMDRLVSFVQGSKAQDAIPSDVDVFEIFARQIPDIIAVNL
jgi:vacuolar protein sorting-associated protein 35